MSNLQSTLGTMIADNWEDWAPDTRMSLWRTFGQAEKQAIWDEYHDRPELCPELPPVYEVQPQVVAGPQAIGGPQAEALRRFDELVAGIQFNPPTIQPPVAPCLPQVKPKVVHGYEYPTPEPKPQPEPPVKQLKGLSVAEAIKGWLILFGWIALIWFIVQAFDHP